MDVDFLRWVVFIVDLIGIIAWVWWLMKNRSKWMYSIAPLSYLVHAFIYYAVFHFSRGIDAEVFVLWNTIIRLQAGFLLLGLVWAMQSWTHTK